MVKFDLIMWQKVETYHESMILEMTIGWKEALEKHYLVLRVV